MGLNTSSLLPDTKFSNTIFRSDKMKNTSNTEQISAWAKLEKCTVVKRLPSYLRLLMQVTKSIEILYFISKYSNGQVH